MDAFFLAGLARIKRGCRTLRVTSDVRRGGQFGVIVRAIPVAHPLPNVAPDVVEAVAILGKLRNRSAVREGVSTRVVIGKVALMGVGHPLTVFLEFIAPGKEVPRLASARGKFPFRFGGQTLSR